MLKDCLKDATLKHIGSITINGETIELVIDPAKLGINNAEFLGNRLQFTSQRCGEEPQPITLSSLTDRKRHYPSTVVKFVYNFLRLSPAMSW